MGRTPKFCGLLEDITFEDQKWTVQETHDYDSPDSQRIDRFPLSTDNQGLG